MTEGFVFISHRYCPNARLRFQWSGEPKINLKLDEGKKEKISERNFLALILS